MGACKPDYIPGTRVEDTSFNRDILNFMGEYESAVESRSAEQVLNLVASDYWEDSGTVDQEDDYGVEKLRSELSKQLAMTKTIMLELHIQNIEEEDDLVRVDYRYRQRALLAMESGDQWVSDTDVNRLVLRKVGKGKKELSIVGGL